MISVSDVPCVLVADMAEGLANGDLCPGEQSSARLAAWSWDSSQPARKAQTEARRMPPDAILAEVKKRERRVTVASLVALPLFALAIVCGAILHPIFLGVFLFLAFIQAMYFVELRQRCPVCGTRLCYGYHQEHKVCPNCGARLELTVEQEDDSTA